MIETLGEGGEGLIYVWAFEQRKGKMSTYLKQKRSNRKPKETGHSASASVSESKTKENITTITQETADSNPQLNSALPHNHLCESTPTNSSQTEKSPSSSSVNNITEMKSLSVHENRTDFAEKDLFVPWKIALDRFKPESDDARAENGTEAPVYHRYYHVFKEGELEEMVLSFPSVQVLESYYDEGNWCVLFKKPRPRIVPPYITRLNDKKL